MKFGGAKYWQNYRISLKDNLENKFSDFKSETVHNSEIWTWTDNGKPYLRVYIGKSGKPDAAYYYRNLESRQESINYWKEIIERRIQRKLDAKASRAEVKNEYKVGDILYASWGYEQTNINFFMVTEVLPKSIKLVEIGQTVTNRTGMMSEHVIPNKNAVISESMTRRVSRYGVKINDVYSASKWHGGEVLQTHYH